MRWWLRPGDALIWVHGHVSRDEVVWGGGCAMGTGWFGAVAVPIDMMFWGGGHATGTWCPCRQGQDGLGWWLRHEDLMVWR